MSRTYSEQWFESLHDSGTGRTYEDLEFSRCHFQGCFAVPRKFRNRPIFRNIRMFDCEQRGCDLRGMIIDNCMIQDLKTNGLLQVWGSVFRHVTLIGRMGRLMVSSLIGVSDRAQKLQREFAAANEGLYSAIDWALDISEAEFEECDLRGLPGHLVRRDPETQVLITRERALEGTWRGLALSGTYWPETLEGLLEEGRRSEVLVAPKLAHDFRQLLEGLQLLRDAGVAEAD